MSPSSTHRSSQHWWILTGLLVGAALGLLANSWNASQALQSVDANSNGLHDGLENAIHITSALGKVFLRLMFMVVLPLVFSALALSVVELGDIRRLGRLGLGTLGLTLLFSTASVLIGLALVNVIRPGYSISGQDRERLRAQYGPGEGTADAQKHIDSANRAKKLTDALLDIIPENPLQEMVGALDGSSKGNGMLSVMFFSLVFGAAMTVEKEKCEPLIACLESLQAVSMRVINWAMFLAPVGAGCLVFGVTATLGLKVLTTLFWFVLTVLLGLLIQFFVTYSIALSIFSRFTPFSFWKKTSEASFTAFGTSSSNATLPTAIRVADEELKLAPQVSRFVLTVGATANQNGTAIYEGVVVLFLAQLMLDKPLEYSQQIRVILMSILAGIGTAGVPGGSLPLIVVLLQSVGVPAGAIGVILGVDRLLDMCRTTLNVTGDLTVAACVENVFRAPASASEGMEEV